MRRCFLIVNVSQPAEPKSLRLVPLLLVDQCCGDTCSRPSSQRRTTCAGAYLCALRPAGCLHCGRSSNKAFHGKPRCKPNAVLRWLLQCSGSSEWVERSAQRPGLLFAPERVKLQLRTNQTSKRMVGHLHEHSNHLSKSRFAELQKVLGFNYKADGLPLDENVGYGCPKQ